MRFLKPLIAIFALLTLFAACKKDAETFDTTPRFYFVNGGTAAAANNLVLFPSSDTVTFNLVISSTYLVPNEATLTLAVADTARESYNAANSTNYAAMPAAAYSFQTTVTVGTSSSIYDTVPLKINKQLLGGENYMLAIVISNISAYKLDTTRRVIYVHTAGSELAGIYNSDGFKTMYAGDSSNNNITDTSSFSLIKNLVPLSDTTSTIDYADLSSNGWKYLFSFENGTFTVKPNNIILNSVEADSFKVMGSTYNPVTKAIYVRSRYKNLSGDERIIEESFTLQ